jgi:ribosomal protein S12 methylthiotransferase accessory factor
VEDDVTTTTATTKVFTRGTHRVRLPEDTWAMIEPRLARYGVTRVSDVTGLDTLGIPVAMATRPLSWTLSVSQGKGQTLTLARVSAAMESVEFWHAERAVPEPAHVATPARALDLPYAVRDLGVVQGPFLSEDSPLDWVEAVGMVSGRRVPVPRDAVFFPDVRAQHWSPASLRANSNGLASGNVRDEAALHALYEIVERDALTRPVRDDFPGAPRIDPESIPDETCLVLVRSLDEVGGRISVAHLPNPFGVPTFRVLIWSVDFSFTCAGHGSHADPLVAVSRACTEAAQGRLAAIAGSRDDLEHYYDHLDRPLSKAEALAQFPEPTSTYAAETAGDAVQYDDVSAELAWLTGLVQDVVGAEPLLVDLSTDPAFSVVKVLVPGALFEGSRVHSRIERRD